MDFRIFVEPQQGATHDQLLAMAQQTRDSGFGGFFRSDHVLAMGDDDRKDDTVGPSDSYVTLAALAVQVPDIRLGTLVTSATFRHPSMLAIAVAGVDQISGGRLELGLGSGWFEAEHRAYGLDFGASFGERFDRLEEQLQIVTGLWATPPGEKFSFAGQHYQLDGAPGLPKPRQQNSSGAPAVPIIVGGSGPKRTPRLAATYASEFNVGFSDLESTLARFERVRAAAREIGRDPATLTYSAALTSCVGRDEAEFATRATAIGRDRQDLMSTGMAGTAAQFVDKLGHWRDAGVERIYFQMLDIDDLEQVALLGDLVAQIS